MLSNVLSVLLLLAFAGMVGLLLAIPGCLVEALNSVFIFVRHTVFTMLVYKCISLRLHWYYNVFNIASACTGNCNVFVVYLGGNEE